MRKNWLNVHVAAAVAAPFLIVLNAHVALAQDNSTSTQDAVETTTTASTITSSDENGAAKTDLDRADELANPSSGRLRTGLTSAEQEYGAFLPPVATAVEEVDRFDGSQELRLVLGDDVYDRRVNISTQANTEVEEVIRLLAERANLNFVYGEGVISGKVTLNLRDVPLGEALKSLLSTQDLAIVREGENVMRIAPRKLVKPGAVADMRTVYVKLNWIQAESLTETLKSVVGGSGGNVQAHKDTNTLVITDTAPNVSILRDLVAQLDVPEKQVMIEARMVELILEAGRSLDTRFGLQRQGSNTGADRDTLDMLFNRANGGVIDFGGVASIFGSDINIDLTLQGLEERNVVNILANPKVITVNNQPALIDIVREIPYVEYQQGSSEGFLRGTVQFKDAGVKLNVLPTITNNGYIRMNLKPEQMIHAGDVSVPMGGSVDSIIPIIDKRLAETNVIVKDEDTVVLGGLRQIDSSNTKSEYPWLGRTPVLGWLFKSDIKGHRKNDLMLFVTPHIVKNQELTPAEKYKYTRVDAHWDLPDYFFDDSVDQREANHRFAADMDPRNFYPDGQIPFMPGSAVDSSFRSETLAK